MTREHPLDKLGCGLDTKEGRGTDRDTNGRKINTDKDTNGRKTGKDTQIEEHKNR